MISVKFKDFLFESYNEKIVYHGSGNKFINFSTSFIGEGEGNQSFGFGLYFTDSKEVAEYYAEKLKKEDIGYIYTVKVNVENVISWYEKIDSKNKINILNSLLNNNIKELPVKKVLYNNTIKTKYLNSEEALNYYPNNKFLIENLDILFNSKKITSEFLYKCDINGIYYPTNTLIFSKKNINSTNYVIFDDNDVKIVKTEKI